MSGYFFPRAGHFVSGIAFQSRAQNRLGVKNGLQSRTQYRYDPLRAGHFAPEPDKCPAKSRNKRPSDPPSTEFTYDGSISQSLWDI